jgi:monothiol glutaredoxin
MPLTETLRSELTELVRKHKVVLFMKGTRLQPQCGFSATVVQILDDFLPQYETVDVLAAPQVREGIKELSQWPTIPQLYVNGEFVGGCDIIKEMNASGELQKVLGVTRAEPKAPHIELSELAAKAFREAAADADGGVLRLEVDTSFHHDLYFGHATPGDVVATAANIAIHLDRASARRADGMSIDYVRGGQGAGFKITNPNEPPRVRALTPAELKAMRDAGREVHVFDVRPTDERSRASLEGAVALEGAGMARLAALPKDATIVLLCHRGMRSRAAAEHLVGEGFRNVYNLEGGIDAWSRTVDPNVPLY